MPHALVALLFFLSQPFWETKTPEQWTLQEIDQIRRTSPWVQSVGDNPPLVAFLATAAPIQEAENELRRRSKGAMRGPDPEYADFLRENGGEVIVLAIYWPHPENFGTLAERRRMEDKSVLVVGHKKYGIVGHFPPEAVDPVLRLAFPREVTAADKSFTIQLYLPGMDFPERDVQFWTKDLTYRGKLEM